MKKVKITAGVASRSYKYVLRHGLGPGTLPKDVQINDWQDFPNDNWKVVVNLNRPLTDAELEQYDIKPYIEDHSPISAAIAVLNQAESTPYRKYYRIQGYPGLQYCVRCQPDFDHEGMGVKGQVYAIRPYDDAEYYWASFTGDGVVKIIRNGRVESKMYLGVMDPEMLNDEDIDEWAEEMDQEIIEALVELNEDIPSVMVHN